MFVLLYALLIICSSSYLLGPKDALSEIPPYVGSAKLNVLSFLSNNEPDACFRNVSVTLQQNSQQGYFLGFVFSEPRSLFCYDGFLLGDLEEFHVFYEFSKGTRNIEWPVPNDPSVLVDLKYAGVRIFRFSQGFF